YLLLQLLPDRPARSLTSAGVRARALTAQRQPAPVAYPTVAAEIHQPLDIHRRLAAQIALDRELRDHVAQLRDLGLGEVFDLRRRIDSRRLARAQRPAAADAVDVRQRDRDVRVDRDIDSRNACHRSALNL